MALEFQKAVLDLIEQVTGGVIDHEVPDWLKRPGKIECGNRWPLICQMYQELTGLELPELMPTKEWRQVDGILKCGTLAPRIIEVDEVQHFNCYRSTMLRLYPRAVPLAFDRNAWIKQSQAKVRLETGKFDMPMPPLFDCEHGRHMQRSFRDALCDILPQDYGFSPTLRIAYFEMAGWDKKNKMWSNVNDARKKMKALLADHNIPN